MHHFVSVALRVSEQIIIIHLCTLRVRKVLQILQYRLGSQEKGRKKEEEECIKWGSEAQCVINGLKLGVIEMEKP